MSNEVPRTPLGPIHLCPKNRPKVSNSDLHRGPSRSLRLTRNIVRRPTQEERASRKDSGGNYDCPRIGHSRPAAGEEHNVPNNTHSRASDDERRPSFCPLCPHGNVHRRAEGNEIGRNREQLRLCRAIAQAVDDAGEEERERVARHARSVITEPVEIYLWVFECLENPRPGELFVSSSVAVILESFENAFPLLGSEELGSCGVVMDKKVRSKGYDHSQQTLLEKHVSLRVENWGRKIHDNEDPPPTA